MAHPTTTLSPNEISNSLKNLPEWNHKKQHFGSLYSISISKPPDEPRTCIGSKEGILKPMIKIRRPFFACLLAVALATGCSSWNSMGKGGAIGAGAGGVLGGVIGKQSGNTVAGIIIGAAIGGTAGAAIGRYMDKQAAELQKDLENADVERVGEGIKITFHSGILFNTDSAALRTAAQSNLQGLAQTLNKYDDTQIVVQGHTDSKGSDDYNLDLSRRRADSVADYLKTQGVRGARLDTAGLGETNPLGNNETEAGRQANRRVEVAIFANDKLKKAAQQNQL